MLTTRHYIGTGLMCLSVFGLFVLCFTPIVYSIAPHAVIYPMAFAAIGCPIGFLGAYLAR